MPLALTRIPGPPSPHTSATRSVLVSRLSRIARLRASVQRSVRGAPARLTTASTPSRASGGNGASAGSHATARAAPSTAPPPRESASASSPRAPSEAHTARPMSPVAPTTATLTSGLSSRAPQGAQAGPHPPERRAARRPPQHEVVQVPSRPRGDPLAVAHEQPLDVEPGELGGRRRPPERVQPDALAVHAEVRRGADGLADDGQAPLRPHERDLP